MASATRIFLKAFYIERHKEQHDGKNSEHLQLSSLIKQSRTANLLTGVRGELRGDVGGGGGTDKVSLVSMSAKDILEVTLTSSAFPFLPRPRNNEPNDFFLVVPELRFDPCEERSEEARSEPLLVLTARRFRAAGFS